MTAFLLGVTQTAQTAGADALPLLSVGAFVAILNAAVTFGIVKGKTDGMESFKDEVRESFAKVNDRIDKVNTELGEVQRALGRLEGTSNSGSLRKRTMNDE